MRLAIRLVGLLLLCSLGAAEAAIQVQVDGDRLTLRAENAPLRDLLQAIATAGRFSLHLEAPLADQITLRLEQQPLMDVLEELLREQSSLIRYTKERGRLRIEEVQVLAPSLPLGGAQGIGRTHLADPGRVAAAAEQTPLAEASAQQQGSLAGDRIAEALALAEGGQDETGRQVLIDLARTHEEPEVRQEALAVLTGFEATPLEPFASAATADKDESVRLLALAHVAEMARTEPGAQSVLREIAERGVVSQIREDELDPRLIAAALLEDLKGGTP